jgi:hypothetical protein
MAKGGIVERFNVVSDIGLCEFSILVDSLFDSFFLQTAEKRLGNRIIPAVATTTDARLKMVGSAESLPVIASIQ